MILHMLTRSGGEHLNHPPVVPIYQEMPTESSELSGDLGGVNETGVRVRPFEENLSVGHLGNR